MIPITVYQNSTVEYTENQQAGTSIYREVPALKPRAALAAHGAGRAYKLSNLIDMILPCLVSARG